MDSLRVPLPDGARRSRSSPTSTPTCRRSGGAGRIDELGIERVYCGGDLVGYGPHPNEVCALIEERAIPTIYGNYDYAIARDLDDCGCAYITPHDRELGQQSVDWTLAHTDRAARTSCASCRSTCASSVGERAVHLVHGSPRKVNEYLFEDKPARLYERLAAAERGDALVFGHTHKPWVHSSAACSSSTAGRSASPRTATRAARSRSSSSATAPSRSTIERVEYDAEAVAHEVAPPACRASRREAPGRRLRERSSCGPSWAQRSGYGTAAASPDTPGHYRPWSGGVAALCDEPAVTCWASRPTPRTVAEAIERWYSRPT